MSTQHAASGIPKFSSEQLAYLATLKNQNNPILEDILKGTDPIAALMAQGADKASQSSPGAKPVATLKVGDVVANRGVYLGEWAGVHAYAAEDFLRDADGKQLLLNFDEATKEFALRNRGWEAGNGTEAALRAEIAKGGNEFEGKLIIPPKELLHGRDVHGTTTRPYANIYTLMNDGKLPKVAAAVQNGSGDQRWALSGSEHPDITSNVYHVRLTDGGNNWNVKGINRSGAVPVRFFRQPTAAGPAPQVVG